jgi:hypothetical protein
VVDQVGAVVEGLHQPGRGEGRVHQQRQAGVVRDGGDGRDVQHVQARVAQRSPNSSRVSGRMAARQASMSPGLHEGGLDAEARQRVVQQVVRAAVQRALATMCDPAPASVATARCSAAWPLAVAMAPDAAFQRRDALSSTALVGLLMRL